LPALPARRGVSFLVSIAANQQRIFLHLLDALRPHWRKDPALPARIQELLARHRAFGARDRRLYRELIYTTLRHLPWIEPLLDTDPAEATRRVAWLAAESPATTPFRDAFARGSPPAGEKSELLPAWFRSHAPEIFSGAELDTQLRRAPVWLRLQTGEPEAVLAEFDARGWPWRRAEALPGALAVLVEADVTDTESWRGGRFEIQDLGSQLVLESIGIEPGRRWLDYCAGAGGKTLQLARLLGPAGHVDAHDIRPAALAELSRRAGRASVGLALGHDFHGSSRAKPTNTPSAPGFAGIAVLSGGPSGLYDGVLVDAPCSGTGTWRRSPHLKWTTTEADIVRAAKKQHALLEESALQVRPGGRLVYATCSLSPRENEEVVTAFLARHHEFQPAPFARGFDATARGAGLLILPARHDTDGFFVASLRRNSPPGDGR